MVEKPLDDTKTYPHMAHWFDPVLLLQLLNNVVVSSIFGQYADRRLMIAALDTVPPEEHARRAEEFRTRLKPDDEGGVWIDWVADLGDGFDSTYAVASLLAKKQLKVGDVDLPRGEALVMGGDEVYPKATRQAYTHQLWQPYAWAAPDSNKKNDAGRPLLAIPGNHDWYDGLVLFLALFSREKPWHVGAWRSYQRRSYFAVRLSETWWLWATDIQLADNMDQPQFDYFKHIAAHMPENSRIILCSAEPGWLYTDSNRNSWEIMEYAAGIAMNAGRGHTIPILLSGDTHHYSRYVGRDDRQYVTSGGGGAFLHPTHQLEQDVSVRLVDHREALKLGTMPDPNDPKKTTAAAYPSFATSRALTLRNAFFAFTNWDFSLLMGGIYFLFAVLISLRDRPDVYALIAAVFGASLIGYTIKQEVSTRFKIWSSSAVHAAAHAAVLICAARYAIAFNNQHFAWNGEWWEVWKWFGLLAAEMVAVGFLIGSTLFGLNMMLTCLLLRMNRNDAFSSLRIGAYNNFLRIRLTNDGFDMFAIGLEKVPQRGDWIANSKHNKDAPDSEIPVFVPKTDLKPHLIEQVSLRFGPKQAGPIA
ncbi:metallophosphoesterase [Bradyrhizobium liaoningense]|uniref:metallophosphoesterase n=1 Tax=Bradyrhizobium liaoningense TaxID=43992 RepID=UPI001BAAD773|nr:metallophosphoesterase [Bradyrhizobium liaoningense]MBR0713962.1 metallophosphoesterase [Bradyrhizobium liaoningense]